MIVHNRKKYTSLDWDGYTKLQGVSFSSIKSFKGEMTFGMQIGTHVHNYISEPEKYNGEHKELVIPLARSLYNVLGSAAGYGLPEVSVSSEFEYEGMIMQHKGRIDRLYNDLVIDFKVINGELKNYINQFGYDNQITGYMASSGVYNGIIIAINRTRIGKPAQVQAIAPNYSFWNNKVLEYGRVINPA